MHLNINRRDAIFKISYCIRQAQSEWKAEKIMGKGLHKFSKVIVK